MIENYLAGPEAKSNLELYSKHGGDTAASPPQFFGSYLHACRICEEAPHTKKRHGDLSSLKTIIVKEVRQQSAVR